MSCKNTARQFLEKLTKFKILRKLPHGGDFFDDLERAFPNYKIELIFDVGANVGQSALQFADRNPCAEIFSFEPISSTFDKLVESTAGKSKITCFNLAFGDFEADGEAIIGEGSAVNQIRRRSEPVTDSDRLTEFKITTLDHFCDTEGIRQINFLKIDTEGGDLTVIKGGLHLLKKQLVDFVEVEAGMHPENKYHVSMELLKKEMESCGYSLFGIYEQMQEWPSGKPNLRRANLVFLSHQILNSHHLTH